jgi:hypothetical protein
MRKLLILLLAAPLYGQSWSNVLSSARAINWGTAGLPATLPDGETTANPWTPPTRPACTTGQAGTTVPIPSGASVTTINSAIASCATANPNGSYLLLAGSTASPATFTVASTQLRLVDTSGGTSHNAVTLRGGGAQATKIVMTGTGVIVFGNAWTSGSSAWTAGFSQGATSITVGVPTSGTIPVAGDLVLLQMCNTGFSGAGCSTGSVADNGNLFLCSNTTFCANQAGNNSLQAQMVRITSITGSGPYTVNFSPGLYMSNWTATGGGSTMSWIGAGSIHSPYGIGLEDLTVDETGIWNTENFGIQFSYVYASWIKGVRIVGSGESDSVEFEGCKNSLIFNSMFDNYSYNRGDLSLSLQEANDSDNLVLNTQMLHGLSWEGLGSNEDDILAYNFIGQTHTLYYEANPFQHVAGTAFTLYEGNETGHITDDDTWGTANLNTFFRNYMSGWDAPYLLSSQCASLSCVAMKVDGGHRFANVIGNAIGSAFLTNYQATLSTPTNGVTNNAAYRWSADMNDPLVLLTVMRWGNVTSVTQSSDTPTNSGIRFVSSEVPASINVNGQCSASASPYSCCTGSGTGTCSASTWVNSVPSNDNLPCSFFLAGYTGTSCTPKYSGGTGLSWWKVCKTWATFPTSCSSTQTQPFPVAGPDLTSGPYVNGYAYDVPAYIAFTNLPIDSAYQNSYSITGSSWSGTCTNQPSGTYACETLTVTGLPSGSAHIMGGFQVTGTSGCNSAAGAEFVMTASSLSGTTGTIVYPLASNPGTCVGGTMLFPDVREFDESVYQNDPSASGIPAAPLLLMGKVVKQ